MDVEGKAEAGSKDNFQALNAKLDDLSKKSKAGKGWVRELFGHVLFETSMRHK